MLLIPCPYCGPRAEIEFRCTRQAPIVPPAAPEQLRDADWADDLSYRNNSNDLQHERWQHVYGCRQWFTVARATVTHEIRAVYPLGAPHSESLG